MNVKVVVLQAEAITDLAAELGTIVVDLDVEDPAMALVADDLNQANAALGTALSRVRRLQRQLQPLAAE